MTGDIVYIAQLRQRLAALELQIAELGPHPAHDEERRALEARASYILHKLNAPDAYHGPDWARRLARPTSNSVRFAMSARKPPQIGEPR